MVCAGVRENIKGRMIVIMGGVAFVLQIERRAPREFLLRKAQVFNRRVYHLLDLTAMVSQVGVGRHRWRWLGRLLELYHGSQWRRQHAHVLTAQRGGSDDRVGVF